MFEMSSGPSAPRVRPDNRMLVVPAALGLAIAVAVTLIGPIDTAIDRAPYGVLGGASYAFGGFVAWAIRRWRAR
jgi:hypothetical protein